MGLMKFLPEGLQTFSEILPSPKPPLIHNLVQDNADRQPAPNELHSMISRPRLAAHGSQLPSLQIQS